MERRRAAVWGDLDGAMTDGRTDRRNGLETTGATSQSGGQSRRAPLVARPLRHRCLSAVRANPMDETDRRRIAALTAPISRTTFYRIGLLSSFRFSTFSLSSHPPLPSFIRTNLTYLRCPILAISTITVSFQPASKAPTIWPTSAVCGYAERFFAFFQSFVNL